MQHFKNIYRAKDLKLRKKFALYYWLPWRWLMLTTSAINAFVTPLVTLAIPQSTFGLPVRLPPFPARALDPRPSRRHRSPRVTSPPRRRPPVPAGSVDSGSSSSVASQLRIMMDTSVITFVTITSFVVCNAIVIAKPKEWLFIICFQLLGMFYLLWNATIVTCSLFRIMTGLAGGHEIHPDAARRGGTKNKGPADTFEMNPTEVSCSGDGDGPAQAAPVASSAEGEPGSPPPAGRLARRRGGRDPATRLHRYRARRARHAASLESAFGWQFAAPESLEPVELLHEPKKPMIVTESRAALVTDEKPTTAVDRV